MLFAFMVSIIQDMVWTNHCCSLARSLSMDKIPRSWWFYLSPIFPSSFGSKLRTPLSLLLYVIYFVSSRFIKKFYTSSLLLYQLVFSTNNCLQVQSIVFMLDISGVQYFWNVYNQNWYLLSNISATNQHTSIHIYEIEKWFMITFH